MLLALLPFSTGHQTFTFSNITVFSTYITHKSVKLYTSWLSLGSLHLSPTLGPLCFNHIHHNLTWGNTLWPIKAYLHGGTLQRWEKAVFGMTFPDWQCWIVLPLPIPIKAPKDLKLCFVCQIQVFQAHVLKLTILKWLTFLQKQFLQLSFFTLSQELRTLFLKLNFSWKVMRSLLKKNSRRTDSRAEVILRSLKNKINVKLYYKQQSSKLMTLVVSLALNHTSNFTSASGAGIPARPHCELTHLYHLK